MTVGTDTVGPLIDVLDAVIAGIASAALDLTPAEHDYNPLTCVCCRIDASIHRLEVIRPFLEATSADHDKEIR